MNPNIKKETNVVVLDRGDYTTCTINLYGATITSWRINQKQQLFVGRQSLYDGKWPIRGGIPIVFPHFGPWAYGPQHGFARLIKWNLEQPPEKLQNEDIEATFSLQDDHFTRSVWTNNFKILYKVTLGEKSLRCDISVENPSKDFAMEFDLLLHTYIKVPEVQLVEISGLYECPFVDKTKTEQVIIIEQEDREIVKIKEFTDRIYQNTPDELMIANVALQNQMRLRKNNFPDIVVWNPWSENAKNMPDLGDEEYRNMLCVEVGRVANAVVLKPGEIFEANQVMKVIYPGDISDDPTEITYFW